MEKEEQDRQKELHVQRESLAQAPKRKTTTFQNRRGKSRHQRSATTRNVRGKRRTSKADRADEEEDRTRRSAKSGRSSDDLAENGRRPTEKENQ